jgi:hypothetical protein
MNPTLEALILAYDALLETRDQARLREYEALLDESLARNPNLSRESLNQAVLVAYRKWARSQKNKPSSLPPTA